MKIIRTLSDLLFSEERKYKRLIEEFPKDVALKVGLLSHYLENQRLEEARQLYNQYRKDFEGNANEEIKRIAKELKF